MIKILLKASDFARPGHIFPLRAFDEGVLRRAGHTEAAVDLCRLASLNPAGVLCEILNENGEMARVLILLKIAKKFDLKIITVKDIISYGLQKEKLVEKITDINFPQNMENSGFIFTRAVVDNKKQIALVKGKSIRKITGPCADAL